MIAQMASSKVENLASLDPRVSIQSKHFLLLQYTLLLIPKELVTSSTHSKSFFCSVKPAISHNRSSSASARQRRIKLWSPEISGHSFVLKVRGTCKSVHNTNIWLEYKVSFLSIKISILARTSIPLALAWTMVIIRRSSEKIICIRRAFTFLMITTALCLMRAHFNRVHEAR